MSAELRLPSLPERSQKWYWPDWKACRANIPIAIKRRAEVDVPRSFAVYEVIMDETNLPAGVTLIKRG